MAVEVSRNHWPGHIGDLFATGDGANLALFRSVHSKIVGIAFIAVNSGKLTIPIGLREEFKNPGAAEAALAKGGIGKVLLTS